MTRAIRDDGKEVDLMDDGTWRIASPSAPSTDARRAADGFRGVGWGAPRDFAVAREGRQPDEASDTALAWSPVQLADLSWAALCIYSDERLVRGKYVLETRYTNLNRYLIAFQSMKELLNTKYGAAGEEQDLWMGDLWKDDPNEWGTAVSSGDLTRYASWNTADTRVGIILTGENYEVSLAIEYSSNDLSGLEDAENATRALTDL